MGFPGGSVVKKKKKIHQEMVDPWIGEIPWRRKWQPALVSCLGNPMKEEPRGLQSMGLQSDTT